MVTKINWLGMETGKNITTTKDISFFNTTTTKKKNKHKDKDKDKIIFNWLDKGLYTPSKKNFSIKTNNNIFPFMNNKINNSIKTKRFPASGINSFPLIIGKKNSITGLKQVSFLTPSKKSSINYFGTSKAIKNKGLFLGQTSKTIQKATFMKPVKMNNKPSYNSISKKSTLLSSEASLYGRTNLKRYGDSDMDGSPNMFDCSPKNVRKDGFFSNLLNKATGGKMGQSDEDYTAEKQTKADDTYMEELKASNPDQSLAEERASKPYKITPAVVSETGETISEAFIPVSDEEVDKTIGDVQDRLLEFRKKEKKEQKDKESEERNRAKDLRDEALINKKEQLAKEQGYRLVEYVVTLPDGTTQKRTRYDIDENTKLGSKLLTQKEANALAEVKKGLNVRKMQDTETMLANQRKLLKTKYIPRIISGETYNAATKKYEASGILPALSSLGSTIGGAVGVSEKFTNLINPMSTGLIPATSTGEWTAAAKTSGYKIRKRPAAILAAMLPPGALTKDVETIATKAVRYPTGSEGKKKGTSREYDYTPKGKGGRPKGTFKNYIPGVGLVGIYDYRKYARKQNAITRMSGPQYGQQYAPQQNPYATAQQYAPTKGINDQGNYDSSQYQAPRIYDQANVAPDQAQNLQNDAQRYQRAQWNMRYQQMMAKMNPYQQAQMSEQMNDNPLKAPNFMKGELTNVGGQNSMTYTNPENNILNAPNVNMGQMRNVGSINEKPAVTLSERPVTNPHGDQFTEIDPVSGKVMLKRRISEKWMTGEAY